SARQAFCAAATVVRQYAMQPTAIHVATLHLPDLLQRHAILSSCNTASIHRPTPGCASLRPELLNPYNDRLDVTTVERPNKTCQPKPAVSFPIQCVPRLGRLAQPFARPKTHKPRSQYLCDRRIAGGQN